MSYILKALKQAQESRSIDGTPVTAASQRLRSMERPKPVEPKAVEPRPVEPIRPPGVAARPAERTLAEPAERPAGDRTATVAPQNQPAPVTAVVTPPPPQPQPESDAGPELRDAMSKFKLEVLVWAADPRDRMVFLSGRKFVEGQSLDGKVVVERIDEDSIVLGYQGQRVRVKRP